MRYTDIKSPQDTSQCTFYPSRDCDLGAQPMCAFACMRQFCRLQCVTWFAGSVVVMVSGETRAKLEGGWNIQGCHWSALTEILPLRS